MKNVRLQQDMCALQTVVCILAGSTNVLHLVLVEYITYVALYAVFQLVDFTYAAHSAIVSDVDVLTASRIVVINH